MTHFSDDPLAPPEKKSRFFLFKMTGGNRAFILLIALFLQIILQPLDKEFPFVSLALQLGLIFAIIFMVADNRHHLIVGLFLGLPASLILIFTDSMALGSLTWIAFGMILLLYLHVIRLMLVQIFNTKKVTVDTIGMACCTYVLLGTLWTLFYIPLAAIDPLAFTFNSTALDISLHDKLTYFSFVTLTTLGYGDVLPVSTLARSLAMIEALTGVLFLAVLISRLVGAYSSDRRQG